MKAATIRWFSFVIATLAVAARGEEYTIHFESNGEPVGECKLSIGDESATVASDDFAEHFDLKGERWQDDESKEWVTLPACEEWAKQSKQKTRDSIPTAPKKIRSFVEWNLDPKFEIEATDDTLTLTSGQVDYKIDVEKVDGDMTNYFRYARLNAYKKAMTAKKLPPFAELLVLDELEKRKLKPRAMEVQIPGVPGAPILKVRYTAIDDATEKSKKAE